MEKAVKNKKNIIIVDDHQLIILGLKQIIEREKDLNIFAEAASAEEAIGILGNHKPDIAIIDISLEGNVNGIDLVKAIKQRHPSIIILVLSMYEESLYAERAIRAGARGYLNKKAATKNIIPAIRTILNDEIYLSNKSSTIILDKMLQSKSDKLESEIDLLSDREFEIFQLIGNGMGTKEISEKLNLSINTVDSHRKHIKKKLNIKNSNMLAKQSVQWVLTHNG